MGHTDATHSRSQTTALEPVKLDVAEFERLTTKRGATTDAERARFFGLPRYVVFRLRENKHEPSLRIALHVATKLNVGVAKLWQPASQSKASTDKAAA